MNPMTTIALRTGAPVAEVVAKTTWMTLQELFRTQPIAFLELTLLARDPQHQLFGVTSETLDRFGLLDSRGRLNAETRDIVLAAVEGDGFDIRLVDPFADGAR